MGTPGIADRRIELRNGQPLFDVIGATTSGAAGQLHPGNTAAAVDELRAARGIGLGVVLGSSLWATIFWCGRILF